MTPQCWGLGLESGDVFLVTTLLEAVHGAGSSRWTSATVNSDALNCMTWFMWSNKFISSVLKNTYCSQDLWFFNYRANTVHSAVVASQKDEFIFVVIQERTCLMFCTKNLSTNAFLEGKAQLSSNEAFQIQFNVFLFGLLYFKLKWFLHSCWGGRERGVLKGGCPFGMSAVS